MTTKLMFSITTILLASSFSLIGTFGKDRDPKLFITDAIKSNLTEIALGKMAAKKAATEATLPAITSGSDRLQVSIRFPEQLAHSVHSLL
jgi:hypothetical protein